MKNKLGLTTKCVHSGGIKDDKWNGITSPVIQSTAYQYRETEKRGYPRYFESPNQQAVIKKLCALEHTEDGIVLSSGMAAISSTILAFAKTSDHIIVQAEVYGGSSEFFSNICSPLGIKCSFVQSSAEAIVDAITDKTVLIFIESPTNPRLSLIDIRKLTTKLQDKDILTVIDNTFATPINQNPSLLGIDIIIHSGTKFLSGHSDLCSGIVLGPHKLIKVIKKTARSLGGCLNAIDCYQLERSLKTLSLRIDAQNRNAQDIAHFLSRQDDVSEINYPGLETSPHYQTSILQMNGHGSMLSFRLSSHCDIDKFMDSLIIINPASSLGGVETTLSAPWYASHAKMPAKQKKSLGITKNLLRLSIGIEDVSDLKSDLKAAIQASINFSR